MENNLTRFKVKDINLISKWDDVEFYAYEALFYSKARMCCICCFAKDTDFIENYWCDVMDLVTTEYMTKSLDSFELWNLYLVFISQDELKKSIQYKIENDKFSMRKLYIQLVDSTTCSDLNLRILQSLNKKLLLDDIVIEHIENRNKSDLVIDISSTSKSALISNKFNSRSSDDIAHRKNWIEKEIEKRIVNEN